MKIIHTEPSIAEIIDDAGIDTDQNVMIDEEMDLRMNIVGSYIPAKYWPQDESHPAEYPDAECLDDPVDLAQSLYVRSGLSLPDDDKEKFQRAAIEYFERAIDEACTTALEV